MPRRNNTKRGKVKISSSQRIAERRLRKFSREIANSQKDRSQGAHEK